MRVAIDLALRMRTSNSSRPGLRIAEKFSDYFKLFAMSWEGRSKPCDYQWIVDGQEEYAAVLAEYSGLALSEARIIEVGYGARPLRLLALIARGCDACGIDLDSPVLDFSMVAVLRSLYRNGLERALKSAVRSVMFGRREMRQFYNFLRERGWTANVESCRIVVGDAARISEVFEDRNGRVDFIYSEDVFEHIPADALERTIQGCAQLLTRNGIALIRPNIFTGITGGHLQEWYAHRVDSEMPRLSEPWEHLRKNRFKANTYLNELSRARYRELFEKHFEILEERVEDAQLGRKWLTPDVQEELSGYSEDELFSNRVRFVLRKRV